MAAALAYAAVAAAVLAAAHRWVLPLSRAAALTLALLPLCFTGRAMITGGVYAPLDLAYTVAPLKAYRAELGVPPQGHNGALSDLFCQILPWQRAARRAWAAGEWPLMNPAILCGDPLQGTAQSAPYHPLNLLSYVALSPAASPAFLATATLFLAGLGAFLFLREVGCGAGPGLIGAAGWMLSDFLAFWVGWPLGQAAAVFPLVLLGVERIARTPERRSVLLLSGALLLSVLAGHPETTAHSVALGGIYGVAVLAGRGWREARRTLAAALAAGGLALLLSAIYILPILEVLPQTAEHATRRAHYATIDRSLSWTEAGRRLIPHLIPFAYGRPGFPPTPEAPRDLAFVAGYVGSLLLPLAVCGVAARSRRRWPLLAIGVLGLLASASAPGVADLLARVPPFDVAINERLAFAWAFAVAALAALGAQALTLGSPGLRARRLLLYSSLALAGFLALWLPRLDAAALEPVELARHLALYLAPLALILGLAVRPPAGWAVPLLILALAAQRAGESGTIYPVLPRRSFYPEVAPLAALPRGGEPYRVVGASYALVPNLSAMWELEDPRGYQALSLARLNATYPLWSLRLPSWFNIVPQLDRPFLSFLNVRFALSGNTDPPPPGWSVAARLRGMQLLENQRVLPRAFVPPRVRRGGNPRRVLREMAEETDFGQRAWIEAPGERPVPVRGHVNGPGRVRTVRDGSGYRLDVDMERRGWVVTSIAAWRGWRASAAGRELPLAYANHAFVAFELPAGRHDVRLRYLPVSFVWGRAISFSSLGILAVAGVMGRVRRRRGAPLAAARE